MNSVSIIASIVVSALIILGAIAAMLAWFYRRGAQERGFSLALDANTKANQELTQEMRDFKGVVVDMFHGLDKRVSLLEATKDSHAS